MKLCDTCGCWDMKPGSLCKTCGKPFSTLHKVRPPQGQPIGGANVRAGPKTARQERDDR